MQSFPVCDVENRISFITDIEGDAAYFDRYIEASEVMKFESAIPNYDTSQPLKFFPYTKQVVFLDSNDIDNGDHTFEKSILVCGGDVWDKGGGDLYVTRQLLSMQNRYGEDRVHFILGNRDINKMRILQEIGIDSSNVMPHHGVYWLKGTGLTGDPELIEMNKNNPSTHQTSNVFVSPSAPERLTWMLQQTLGCPDAFELRREELEREKGICCRTKVQNIIDEISDCTVTDEEVVQSYRESCHPTTGLMGEYIRKGKIAMRIGGALFIHGSIPVSPEILMEYKTYSSRLGSVSTLEKEAFWNKFFCNAMPWLSDSNTPSQRSVQTEWSFINFNDSNASNMSATSLGSESSYPKLLSTSDFKSSNGIADPKSEKSSLCNKLLKICGMQKRKSPDNSKSKGYSNKEDHQDESNHFHNNSNRIERKRNSFRESITETLEGKTDDNWTTRIRDKPYDEKELGRQSKVSFKVRLSEEISPSDEKMFTYANKKAKEIDALVDDIDGWIKSLNAFSKRNYDRWAHYVTHNPKGRYCWSRHGGYSNFGALIQFGMGWLPNKEINQSVIYSTWITDGMPQMVCGKTELDALHAKFIAEFFAIHGLDLIVSGHQPIGDSPLTIQVESSRMDKPKFVVIGDTSFSGDTIWLGGSKNMGRGKAKSGRGEVAVSEILIDTSVNGDVMCVTHHGRLSNGLKYKSCNIRDYHPDSSLVGKLLDKKQLFIEGEDDDTATEWIIRAKLSDDSFLVSRGKGFQVINAIARKRV